MTSTRGRPRYDDILTPREWQVIDLLEQGLTNEQIAGSLQISFGGAKFHVAEIISKLGAEDRHEAVRLAREQQRQSVGMLGWILTRLRFPAHKRVLVGGAAAVILPASVMLLALLTNRIPWPSSGSNDPDLGQALADFESGGSQHDFLAQAQFDPTGCVTGEEARNPRHPSGIVLPLRRSFNTIEEAERFLCLPIPRPRSSELRLHDRVVPKVSAQRSHDLETLMDPANGGKGGRMAEARYLPSQGAGAEFEFHVCTKSCGQTAGSAEAVRVQGTEGKLFRGGLNAPDGVMVTWEKNGYGFRASTPRLADYGLLQEFLAMLETVS